MESLTGFIHLISCAILCIPLESYSFKIIYNNYFLPLLLHSYISQHNLRLSTGQVFLDSQNNRNDNWSFARLLEEETTDLVGDITFDVIEINRIHTGS